MDCIQTSQAHLKHAYPIPCQSKVLCLGLEDRFVTYSKWSTFSTQILPKQISLFLILSRMKTIMRYIFRLRGRWGYYYSGEYICVKAEKGRSWREDSSFKNFSRAFRVIHFEKRDQQFSLPQWLVCSSPSNLMVWYLHVKHALMIIEKPPALNVELWVLSCEFQIINLGQHFFIFEMS